MLHPTTLLIFLSMVFLLYYLWFFIHTALLRFIRRNMKCSAFCTTCVHLGRSKSSVYINVFSNNNNNIVCTIVQVAP